MQKVRQSITLTEQMKKIFPNFNKISYNQRNSLLIYIKNQKDKTGVGINKADNRMRQQEAHGWLGGGTMAPTRALPWSPEFLKRCMHNKPAFDKPNDLRFVNKVLIDHFPDYKGLNSNLTKSTRLYEYEIIPFGKLTAIVNELQQNPNNYHANSPFPLDVNNLNCSPENLITLYNWIAKSGLKELGLLKLRAKF